MGTTKDPRKEKIRELKGVIKEAQGDLDEFKKNNIILESMTEETKKEKRSEISKKIAILQGLEEELKKTRMNKNSSSFFSFTSTPGMNRRQRKLMRRRTRV